MFFYVVYMIETCKFFFRFLQKCEYKSFHVQRTGIDKNSHLIKKFINMYNSFTNMYNFRRTILNYIFPLMFILNISPLLD